MKTTMFISSVLACVTLVWGVTGCAASTACPKDYEAQLDKQITVTFEAMREGRASVVLNSVSETGLTVNGTHFARTQLTQPFQNRSGIYCELFACQGQSGPVARAFQVRSEPLKQYDETNLVALVLNAPNTNDEVMLTYRYSATRCMWELVDITAP